MKTSVPNKKDKKTEWYVLDASSMPLGRLATKAASLLLGKNKVSFVYNQVPYNKVIIINAKKVQVTGNKRIDKKYYRHSGYPKGLKERSLLYYLEKNPSFIFVNAIKGMLPKNKLRDKLLKNLYVYEGSDHPHKANVSK